MDGTSIWAGDGVHLTSNASRVAARKLMADLVRGGKESEPATKRTRLESVVPAPAPAKKKVAATGQPPTSPPRPCPPPLWLSGQLPPSQRGRGSGHQNPTQSRGKAAHAAATVVPTVDREGRSEAASAAAGAAGRMFETVHTKGN